MEQANHKWLEAEPSYTPGGFRLQQLEVYNWGTFHQRVWRITPNGGISLLTGANGSGKSTLADALLTLFVPFHRRTYNQASGTEKHRERNEATYVRGAWSKQRDTDSNTASVQYLRGKDSYSVLLAVFSNAYLDKYVTMAQVFWWQQDELRKFFVVSTQPLSIAEHFIVPNDMTGLRKQLKAWGAEVYDEFAKYSRRFCLLLGLRSEKALDLFNQIVSIKDIGGLNAFVREHMLEKTDAQERITELRNNFHNLTRAHAAIELAERQVAVLEPLMKDGNDYERLLARIAEAERCVQVVPIYIAGRKKSLLETAITNAQEQLNEAQNRGFSLDQQLGHLSKQQIDLNVAIQNDQVGQRLELLKQEIKTLAAEQHAKEERAGKYDTLARKVSLPEYRDEATFYETHRQAATLLTQTTQRLTTLTEQRDEQKQHESDLNKSIQNIADELTSLKQRKSQIPRDDVVMRARLMQALAIPEEDLPFVGELLRVRETAQSWEGAIERLLHGFGRQLLVPEQHYVKVSRYVDVTDLRARLVYHRVRSQHSLRNPTSQDRNMLLAKLEAKPLTNFTEWLTAEIAEFYDYLCCETLEEFQQARRALTINGQIKHGPARHEKDDRFPLDDRKRYVLGWNNTEKLAAIQAEITTQHEMLQRVKNDIRELQEEQGREQERKHTLQRLLEFEEFLAIDWHADERRKHELERQRRLLGASANHLAELQRQLDGVNEQLKDIQDEQKEVLATITTLKNTIEFYERQLSTCRNILQMATGDDVAQDLTLIEREQKNTTFTIESSDETRDRIIQFYRSRATSLRGQQTPLISRIIGLMNDLKRISPEAMQEFGASIEALEEYKRLHERIRHDDLPRYRRRFKELLDETVITNIMVFKAALETQVENIKASIASLNASLRVIDYTPSTYIQLCYDQARDSEIRDFKVQLRACLPDVAQPRTAEANEASFQRIQALIGRFEQEERWTGKVTDVRNWLDFSAEERYREDDVVKNYYSDSSGRSGGQKTKLAYTILASAIAYQYALDQEEGKERAFRFVVIDEAFVRSDELNARYAMELFRQLDLQLLMVTPLDKIHVIEPYISACHYVTNNEEENDSKVYDLTIEEYYEHKQELQTGVMIVDYSR